MSAKSGFDVTAVERGLRDSVYHRSLIFQSYKFGANNKL